MLLNRKSFELIAAASDDEDKPALHGVHFNEDGSAVATDGHLLVRFSSTEKPNESEYPQIDGIKHGNGNVKLKPFSLPVSAAKAVLRVVPKGRKGLIPILRNVVLDVEATNKGSQVVLGFTDLKRPTIMKPEKLHGDFPDYQSIMPKGKPELVISLQIEALHRVIKVLENIDVEYVEAHFRSSSDVIVLTGTTMEGDGDVLAVLAPSLPIAKDGPEPGSNGTNDVKVSKKKKKNK